MVAVLAVPAPAAAVARPGKTAHPARTGSLDGDGEVRVRSAVGAADAVPDGVMGVWSARSGTATGWFEVHFDPFVIGVGANSQ